jgi:hypothetical protein
MKENQGAKKMNIKQKNIPLAAIFLSFLLIFAACSSKSAEKGSNLIPTINAKLIYEETVSPNEAYVTSSQDVVYYYIKIYQDDNNKITVKASSNSALSEDMQYTLDYDKPIAKEDVDVSWTTLMGNPEPSEDDQFCIAKVSLSKAGAVFSERKINFAKKGIEIVVDALNHNK